MYKVVPRNRGGLLRTWPLLIVILRISSTHFLQRVRVFFKHLKETQHLLGTIKQKCIIFKLGKSATWDNLPVPLYRSGSKRPPLRAFAGASRRRRPSATFSFFLFFFPFFAPSLTNSTEKFLINSTEKSLIDSTENL